MNVSGGKSGEKPRQFTIEIAGDPQRAVCELVGGAPWTTTKMWALLQHGPLTLQGIHAKWAGREIAVYLPEQYQFDVTGLCPENSVHYPIPGDICFWYWPPGGAGASYDIPHPTGVYKPLYDIQLIYGRESEFKVVGGIETRNLWARVVEGLDELARACARLQVEGVKNLTLTALP
jgi:hypothetical protein